jgi:hypothetical protein
MTTQLTSAGTEPKTGAQPPKPVTVSSCITPEQVAKPQPALFVESKGTCNYETFYMSSGRLNFTMKCTEEGTSVAAIVDGNYTATTLEAVVDTVVYVPGSQVNNSAKLTGRRVGECTAAPADTAKS